MMAVSCSSCKRSVVPMKGFSFPGFLLGFGILYLLYWMSKKPVECPACGWWNVYERLDANHTRYTDTVRLPIFFGFLAVAAVIALVAQLCETA